MAAVTLFGAACCVAKSCAILAINGLAIACARSGLLLCYPLLWLSRPVGATMSPLAIMAAASRVAATLVGAPLSPLAVLVAAAGVATQQVGAAALQHAVLICRCRSSSYAGRGSRVATPCCGCRTAKVTAILFRAAASVLSAAASPLAHLATTA